MSSRMILIFLLAPAMLAGAADLKVTTIRSAPRGARLVVDRGDVLPPSKETIYVHEKAQREEFVGYVEAPLNHGGGPAPHMAVITHCDTGVVDQLDLDAHEYREVKMERYPDEKAVYEEAGTGAEGRPEARPVQHGGYGRDPGLSRTGSQALDHHHHRQ